MKKRSKSKILLLVTVVVVLVACNTKKPEKPVKPITDEQPTKTLQAETINEVKFAEKAKAGKKDLAPAVSEPGVHAVPLTVIVNNLESPSAPVEMSVYGPHNKFLDTNDQLKKYRFKPQDGKLVAKISDLSYGEFALALYQDVNSDGKIDKNFVGIPEEPYAFSNNYKPVIKAPTFKDCKFDYSPKTNTVNVSLLK